jgi:hypothetical protein
VGWLMLDHTSHTCDVVLQLCEVSPHVSQLAGVTRVF